MVIIHVAGISGAGKSFIGEFIKNIYPVSKIKVIDLDDIIQPAIDNITRKYKDFEKGKKCLIRTIDSKIDSIIKKYKTVLFVGINAITFNNEDGSQERYETVKMANKKYYIDVPFNKSSMQYRDRAAKIINFTQRGLCIDSIAEYRKSFDITKKIYRGKKYKFLSQESIIRDLILFLK